MMSADTSTCGHAKDVMSNYTGYVASFYVMFILLEEGEMVLWGAVLWSVTKAV